MNAPLAFLFDLNGTMIDDMSYHIQAWHRILNNLGANISLEKMKEECYGKNEELLERIFPNRFSPEEKKQMSFEKEKAYQTAFTPSLQLISGLPAFLEKAYQKHIPMAIGSAAIMYNIDFVLNGLHLHHYINAVVSADDVKNSKPHPETFTKCALALGISPANCIVFEDAPKGVEAAKNAGMKAIVITTLHEAAEFNQYDNILFFIKDYNDPKMTTLLD